MNSEFVLVGAPPWHGAPPALGRRVPMTGLPQCYRAAGLVLATADTLAVRRGWLDLADEHPSIRALICPTQILR